MTAFPKTRAAAGYAARHGPGELARARATFLLARLGACEDFLPGGDGDVTADLRDLVLAARDLAGPAWLQASGDDRPGGARRDHFPGPVGPLRPAWRRRPPRASTRPRSGRHPMNHDSLTIGVRHEPGYVLNPAAGETGIFTVARPREELFTLAGDGRPVIADLDRVTFPGAAGLGALAGAARRAAPGGPACMWSAPGRRPGSSSGWPACPAPCGSPAPWPKRSRPCPPPRARPPGRHSPFRPRPEVTTMTMTEPGFPVRVTRGVPVVIAPAEIDITNAGQLRAALLHAAARPAAALVVDMTRTRFCDCAGLHALIGAHKRARAEGQQVRLAVTGPQVRRILALTALDRLIPVYASLDHALAHPPRRHRRPWAPAACFTGERL